MKDLLLPLYFASFAVGAANIVVLTWKFLKIRNSRLFLIAGYFGAFTILMVGPNLEFFQSLPRDSGLPLLGALKSLSALFFGFATIVVVPRLLNETLGPRLRVTVGALAAIPAGLLVLQLAGLAFAFLGTGFYAIQDGIEAAALLCLFVFFSIRTLRGSGRIGDSLSRGFLLVFSRAGLIAPPLIAAAGLWTDRPPILSPLSLLNLTFLAASAASIALLFRFARSPVSATPVESGDSGDREAPAFGSGPARLRDSGLSEREKEIVILLNQGLAGKEIAGRLNIAEATVKNHIYNIYQKTGVKGRVELLNLFR